MSNHPVVPPNHIRLDIEAPGWREAIQQAAQPLLESGAITPAYVRAMEKVMEDLGPYFVIVPGVALAHARPEEGALRPAISAARLARPVAFGHADNDPVWLVIVLAGSNNESHLGLLQQVARFLGNEPALAELRRAATPQEAAAALNAAM